MRRSNGAVGKDLLHEQSSVRRPRKKQQTFDVRDLVGLDPQIRLRIEATVLDMFSEQEFHRVNLGELASQAKTSLQTIYKYYGSKEALVLATLDRELGELAARMTDH